MPVSSHSHKYCVCVSPLSTSFRNITAILETTHSFPASVSEGTSSPSCCLIISLRNDYSRILVKFTLTFLFIKLASRLFTGLFLKCPNIVLNFIFILGTILQYLNEICVRLLFFLISCLFFNKLHYF